MFATLCHQYEYADKTLGGGGGGDNFHMGADGGGGGGGTSIWEQTMMCHLLTAPF